MAKKKTRARRGTRGLGSVSTQALQAELDRRLDALQARREELQAELEAVEAEIGSAEGVAAAPARRRRVGRPAKKKRTTKRGRRPAKKTARRKVAKKKRAVRGGKKKTGRRGRPRNETSLVGALHKLLKNTTMSVTDMADAVQKAGYKTGSPNFRTIVNQTLINNPSMFKRVARGQYTAK